MANRLWLALGLNAVAGHDMAANTTVMVEPDADAYRLSETALLDAEVRAALNAAAAATAYEVDSMANAEGVRE